MPMSSADIICSRPSVQLPSVSSVESI